MAKKDQELARAENEAALAATPASLEELKKYSGLGTEDLGGEDVRPPRLICATSMHPQVKRGDPKLIEDLREGDLFNDLTQEIYGEGPMEIIVIKFLGKRWVQFEDGKVVDGNVPADDPRTEWKKDDEGNSYRDAVQFYDYLLWLPEKQEMVTFSLKGQQAAKVGVPFNSLLKSPLKIAGKIELRPPSFARVFEIKTNMEKNDLGSWAVANVRPKRQTDSETLAVCAALYSSFTNRNVVVDTTDEGGEREPGQEG